MAKRIIEQFDISALAGTTVSLDAFTVPKTEKRKLVSFGVTAQTANVDLLMHKQRELICDIPTDTLCLVDKMFPFEHEFDSGEILTLSNRNGTAGVVVLTVILEMEISE